MIIHSALLLLNQTEEMLEEHIRRATTENACAGIFWDFQSASVPLQHIEDFAEQIRIHLEGFQSKTFIAVATDDYIKNNGDLTERMFHATIELNVVENDERRVAKTNEDQMLNFYDNPNRNKHGCCMVLITGSYEFHRTIMHYKHGKDFQNLVLVYFEAKSEGQELSRRENEDLKRLAVVAPKKIPLSYFMDLIITRKEALKDKEKQELSSSRAFVSVDDDKQKQSSLRMCSDDDDLC